MAPTRTARAERLAAWIDALDPKALAAAVVGEDPSTAHDVALDRVTTYAHEAFVGLELIEAALDAGPRRVLEVGSGAGILSRFLRGEGFDVTGIEPSIDAGFSFMQALDRAVRSRAPQSSAIEVWPIGAEALDPETHGRFDLIYSANVLEHVADLDAAVAGMVRVLDDDGLMLHQCPNYRVPYEPHLGIPLVPGAPASTRALFPDRVEADEGLWNSLNFVTAGRLERVARRHGLHCRFRGDVMARTFERLRDDPSFGARHAGLSSLVGRSDRVFRTATRVLGAVPATWQSPMTVAMRFADRESAGSA